MFCSYQCKCYFFPYEDVIDEALGIFKILGFMHGDKPSLMCMMHEASSSRLHEISP